MQMLIGLACLGIEGPHMNARTGAAIGKLYFRGDPHAAKEKALTISGLLPVVGKSDAFMLGGVTTQWFDLDPVKENWLFKLHRLVGIKAEIKISCKQLITNGTADIEINAWGKYGQIHQLLNRKDLQTDGTHFPELNIRGVIR